MSYSAIITQVQCDVDAAPRLACAVDMAKRFDAALIGVGAEMIQLAIVDDGFVQAEWITAMRTSIDERLALARKRFAETAGGLELPNRWMDGIQMPALALAAASRAADLIVAGGVPHRYDAYCAAPPAELALTSGRPVLVAPTHGRALDAKSILLAWKDTREARRALSDALPFLQRAEAVHVVEACAGDAAEDARGRVEDVAGALRRRGVEAQSDVLVQPHTTGWRLIEHAKALGADLIVCGAYGHSRLGEWVFGGVTQDLLAQDEVYLLLSH